MGVAVRVDGADGIPLIDVVQRHVDKQVRLSHAGLPDAVDMVQPICGPDAEQEAVPVVSPDGLSYGCERFQLIHAPSIPARRAGLQCGDFKPGFNKVRFKITSLPQSQPAPYSSRMDYRGSDNKNKPAGEKVILDLCGGTGAWSRPYRDAGYDVRVLTLPEYDVERWRDYPEIVELLHSNRLYGILAAPPCTMFSLLRNDKIAALPRDFRKGMRTVNACLEIVHECLYHPVYKYQNSLRFWALENPRGHLGRFLGKSAYAFDPFEFGDPYTKRTCLWGVFNEPKKNPVVPLAGNFVRSTTSFKGLKTHQIPEGYIKATGIPTDTVIRSITPEGFARAFFEANR